MTVFAVQYTYDNRASVRDEVRPAHRAFLAALESAGALLASGPFAEDASGVSGALLIVAADSPEHAAALLDDDPFAQADLIASREIRSWTQVYGPWTP